MTPLEFGNFRDGLLKEALGENDRKSHDYGSSVDVLANFKRQAERWGLDPIQVWGVYFGKHVDSVETFVKDGELKAESVRSRFVDLLNYVFLGAALVEDLKPQTQGRW